MKKQLFCIPVLFFLCIPFFVSCGDDDKNYNPIYGDMDFEKMTLHEIKRGLQGNWKLETKTYKESDGRVVEVDYTKDHSYQAIISFRNEEYKCFVACPACYTMPVRWEVPKWEKKITVTGKAYYCCTPEYHGEFAPIRIEAGKLTIMMNNESEMMNVYKRLDDIVEY